MSKKFIFTLFILGLSHASVWAQGKAATSSKEGLTTTGFIDVQMQWGRGSLELNGDPIRMPGEATGFRIYQGAMMLASELEQAEVLVDIPFRSHPTTGTDSNDLELATEEAQAYIKFQYEKGPYWQFGQFDSPFGLESNDTIDMVFTQFGVLQPFTPNTHTGLLVGYTFLPFYLQLIAGNGDSTSVQDDDQSMQFGARLGWNQEPMQFSFGALYTRTRGRYVLPAGSEAYQPNVILNAVFQTRIQKLELGIEANAAQSRLAKYAEVGGASKDHDLVYGVLAQALFHMNDHWSFGARVEYLKNDETNEFVRFAQADSSVSTTTTLSGQGGYIQKASLGVRKTMSELLVAKAGVDMVNLNIGSEAPSQGKSQNWIQGSVGMVYNF